MNILEKRYNEESDKVYILEFDVQYQENLHNLHYDLLSLPEIKNFEKSLVAILQDKIEYVIHIRNHESVLKKLYRIIISSLKIYLQSSINMNTDLKKNTFKKDFSELVNNASFGKTIENVKKYQLVRTKKGRTY